MDTPSFDGWTCPIPLKNYPTIVMGHGAGGKMMNDLIQHLFASEFITTCWRNWATQQP